MARRIKIFFDGGCRPNPGRMEIAVVAGGRAHVIEDAGEGTSEEAEWLALIHALRIAREMAAELPKGAEFLLLGDAAGVVRQAAGAEKARGACAARLEEWCALVAGAPAPLLRHIRRAQNLAGIALAALHPR